MPLSHASLTIMLTLMTGCAGNWVGVDGTPVDHATIAVASETCRVTGKIQMLKRTRALIGKMKAEAQTDSDQLSQAYDEFEKRVNDDIATCMRGEGLVES